jgi:periplasmic protein TonB
MGLPLKNPLPDMTDEVMNQPIGSNVHDGFYRPGLEGRFAVTGPMAVVAIIAMLLGTRFIKPNLPHPRTGDAIEARLVEIVPPQPAGLQGGAAPAKPKPVEKPHPQHKTAVARRPKVEAPPIISPSETSEVGTGPSVPTTSGPPAAKEASVGVPGGSGVGSGAGIGNDTSGARAIYAPTPTIPDDLREDAFHAVAVAHFWVARDGTIKVTLTQPTQNPRLNQILLATLREWQFFPAMKDGIAIASEFDVRIPISVE